MIKLLRLIFLSAVLLEICDAETTGRGLFSWTEFWAIRGQKERIAQFGHLQFDEILAKNGSEIKYLNGEFTIASVLNDSYQVSFKFEKLGPGGDTNPQYKSKIVPLCEFFNNFVRKNLLPMVHPNSNNKFLPEKDTGSVCPISPGTYEVERVFLPSKLYAQTELEDNYYFIYVGIQRIGWDPPDVGGFGGRFYCQKETR